MSAALETHLAIVRSAAAELELECDRYARESGVMPAAATFPPPAEEKTDPDLVPIATGKARLNVAGAFLDLLTAVNRAQSIADAIARALDAQEGARRP